MVNEGILFQFLNPSTLTLPYAGITDKEQIYSAVKGFHEQGVNVTTFGIGASFDEELMKGIAEHGRGDYFFIEGADDIMNKVEKGMKVLSELLCRNAVLKLRGLNGGLVTKIVSHPDESLIGGAHVGDISEDDLRQVIAHIEVSNSSIISCFSLYLSFFLFPFSFLFSFFFSSNNWLCRCDLMYPRITKMYWIMNSHTRKSMITAHKL